MRKDLQHFSREVYNVNNGVFLTSLVLSNNRSEPCTARSAGSSNGFEEGAKKRKRKRYAGIVAVGYLYYYRCHIWGRHRRDDEAEEISRPSGIEEEGAIQQQPNKSKALKIDPFTVSEMGSWAR